MPQEVLREDDSDGLLSEELVLPWQTNLAEKTRADYFHDSRWFLEFAGFLDPGHWRRQVFQRETDATPPLSPRR